jgi:hypothetical protein
MYRLLRTKYTGFAELPFEQFNEVNIEIYITDHNWNFLFVNNYAQKRSGNKKIVGKNLWQSFEPGEMDANFNILKKNLEQGIVTNFVTPARNMKKQNVIGFPLKDCFYISASEVPNKQDLIHELRGELGRK